MSPSEPPGEAPGGSVVSGSTMRSRVLVALAVVAALAAGWLAGLATARRHRPAPAPAAAAAAPSAGSPALPAAPRQPAAGKWHEARSVPEPPPGGWEHTKGAEALMAVPYLQGYRPARASDKAVTLDRPEAWRGLNLYVSGDAPEARLMDMEGHLLHRWIYPLEKFRPEVFKDPATRDEFRKLEYFRRARLLPDGRLLAIFEGLGLVELAPDSHLLWAYRGGAHHDLDVAPDGRIFVLDREGKVLPWLDPDHGVLEDMITELSPDGRVLDKISIPEAFRDSIYAPLLERRGPPPDVFHTNTLEILDGSLADQSPAFRRGNLLISVLQLDTVAVIDPRSRKVVWAETGMWRKQHQPTVLANGHLLIFDNTGPGGERSRVLELDPFSQQVFWHYGGDPGTDLYSQTLGSAQRLPNGDTLITESENGRALEVDRAGKVVWQFLSPHRVGDHGQLVAVLFEMVRLPPDFPFQGSPSARDTAGSAPEAARGARAGDAGQGRISRP